MSVKFEQFIIKAPFILTKGFLLGYRHSKPEGFKYFFNRKSGIKRDTLAGAVRGFFDMSQYSFLCIESSVADDFERALNEVSGFGVSLESRAVIKAAQFKFSVEVYNKDLGDTCREIFSQKPDGLQLVDFSQEEDSSDRSKVRAKGASHAYSYRARGLASGEFEGVMNLYLSLKKSDLSDFALCNEIVLAV